MSSTGPGNAPGRLLEAISGGFGLAVEDGALTVTMPRWDGKGYAVWTYADGRLTEAKAKKAKRK